MTNTAEHSSSSASMAMPDPRPAFAKAVAVGRQVVAGVGPEQLDNPTPCADFDVRTVGRHLLAVLQRVAVVGSGRDSAESPDFVEDVADDAWIEAYDHFTADIDAVWSDDAVLTNILTLAWAELPGAIAMTIYINEVSVHTWDLATATGQSPSWDNEVLSTAYAAIQQGLPAEGREHPYVPFAEVVPTPADAALIDQLVAWNGRRPEGGA